MTFNWKHILLALFLIILATALYIGKGLYDRLHPTPRIDESATSIIGFNHIGINVLDLDEMLKFYQDASGYKVIKRYKKQNDLSSATLYGRDSISYERAILQGPNMLLELTEFDHQPDSTSTLMPPQGPGMTHTCYQSPISDSGFEKFVKAGADVLTLGGKPVDMSGFGVTYAYAYDPEGNMIELEQMPKRILSLAIGSEYAQRNPIWMTQVALMTPNLERMVLFYENVLGIEPYRVGEYGPSPQIDSVAAVHKMVFKAGWFGMDKQGKKLEIMSYNGMTDAADLSVKSATDLGYTYSYEVLDIQAEYDRLVNEGLTFLSAPQRLDDYWEVITHDIDGNIFSLRQAIDPNSSYSLANWE